MHACMHAWPACPAKACTEVIGLSVRQLYSLDPACGAEPTRGHSPAEQPGPIGSVQPRTLYVQYPYYTDFYLL
jgi:hypothetical protein